MPSDSLILSCFENAVASNASDVHLLVDQPPIYRIQGVLAPGEDKQRVTDKVLLAELRKLLSAEKMAAFEQHGSVDASYDLGKKARFRLNAYSERNRPALEARLIPPRIPSLEELDVPPIVPEFTMLAQGLVLVTGPTGAGKSTLLASMIEHINESRPEHIVTLEDPVEFVHEPKQSIISQRELGTDFTTFAEGLKHVFRQDPNIILVGEMRDPETIALALTLAETGHLVFATLHTNGAAQTVERIIDTFPAGQQDQIRLQLSLMLSGVISQLLVPSVEGRLIPVREVLVNTHAVSTIIRDGRTQQLQNAIYTSSNEGMVDLDQELAYLVKQKIISRGIARLHAREPKEF